MGPFSLKRLRQFLSSGYFYFETEYVSIFGLTLICFITSQITAFILLLCCVEQMTWQLKNENMK